MKPIKRKTTNTIFKRPDCFDLPGTKYKYEDETPAIETCWQLSKEELEKINKSSTFISSSSSLSAKTLLTDTAIGGSVSPSC